MAILFRYFCYLSILNVYLKNMKNISIATGGLFFVGIFILFFSIYGLKEDDVNSEINKKQSGKRFYGSVEIPQTLYFAGEQVPLDHFDVYEQLDREMLSNSFFHSQTIRYIKLAPRYFSVIEPILKKNGIPDDFKFLCLAESGFNERIVSPAGAVGLWQFMKGTAIDYGLEINREVDERYHMEKSTVAACKYLKDSYEKYGNWTMVAASYNAGRNSMNKQIERQKDDCYYNLLLNTETSRYVFRILALKLVISNPEKYGFKIPDNEKYPIIETKLVEEKGAVTSFADFAKSHGISYKILKMFNPWLRQAYLTNTAKKTYQIKIPVLK